MEMMKVVNVTIEDVEDLHTLGRIQVGDKVVYSGKEQWEGEERGVFFPVGCRLPDSLVKYLDMEGMFGEDNVVQPKTFRKKYTSEGFLVPLRDYNNWFAEDFARWSWVTAKEEADAEV